MHDLSPGQEVTVFGMGGGAATVVYTTPWRVRVTMVATGKQRSVPVSHVTPKRESKALSMVETADALAAPIREMERVLGIGPSRPVPKPVTLTSPAYLAYVRKHPCCLCGRSEGIEAHHWSHHGGVMGSKVDDYRTVPLCQEHRRHWHDHGTLPGHGRAWSGDLFRLVQRELLVEWSTAALCDGDMVDALIRAIGGAT